MSGPLRNKILTLVLTGLILTQMFQNCGQLGSFETLDQSSTQQMASMGTDHPAQSEVTMPTQKVQVVNRQFVAQMMREIFTSSTGPVTNLENLIQQWIFTRGAQYGEGCNPYSSYSGADCGGDISNANLPAKVDDNTVRESFRIQFCENILGTDEGLNALLEKISNRSVAPTADTIKQVYGLFYRGEGASSEIINSLLDLDRTLALNNEAVKERWRALALQVCESSGWQLQ
ncbi:MAG: hypothetical protein ACXVCP_11595 [Bdellovibrio sp.]